MEISDIKWAKYDPSSIDFILNESEKLIDETFKSFRAITDKCYYALGIYIGVLSYCITKIIEHQGCDVILPYYIILIGMCFCIAVLFRPILPANLIFPGTQPKQLLIDFFENIPKEDQSFAFKIQIIVANENGIENNKKNITDRVFQFKTSIYIFIGVFLIALLCYLIFI